MTSNRAIGSPGRAALVGVLAVALLGSLAFTLGRATRPEDSPEASLAAQRIPPPDESPRITSVGKSAPLPALRLPPPKPDSGGSAGTSELIEPESATPSTRAAGVANGAADGRANAAPL